MTRFVTLCRPFISPLQGQEYLKWEITIDSYSVIVIVDFERCGWGIDN